MRAALERVRVWGGRRGRHSRGLGCRGHEGTLALAHAEVAAEGHDRKEATCDQGPGGGQGGASGGLAPTRGVVAEEAPAFRTFERHVVLELVEDLAAERVKGVGLG